MTKTIAVIGLGSIGMRHAKNLIAMGHRVIAFDPANTSISDGITTYDNLRTLLHQKYDGIIIASPTKYHLYHVGNVSLVNPVFVEKPIARATADEFVAIREEVGERLAPTMMGNNLRFHSCVKKAKEWLAEGKIGKPLWASFCVAQYNTKYTDPVALNWGAHEVDLALYLLGPATVTAAAGNDQIFDMCLLHEGGVPSTIHMDYVTDPERRAFHIMGSDGQIYCRLPERAISLLDRKENIITKLFTDNHGSWDQDYKDEMRAFIDLIDGKPVPHAATGQDGLNALEVILEAQRVAAK